jgi:hypothetical protein
MDLETAVASVVLAETTPGTPLKRLKRKPSSAALILFRAGPHSFVDFVI